ncbi:adenylosuccinate synthetase, partial [Planctomycetaceae bacterium]|nr:adenylosuccinate synthetase [Planctomycetaceae bacterium]
MSATAVIGLQWGDEAKGKVVDLLTDQHDIVVRYLGGNNAGHTVKFDGKTYKLSLLPAGILHEGITSVIAGGVVINPQALLKELDQIISQKGELNNQLMISDRAHVIMPYHLAEERVLEASLKDAAIGTTMRGIGTCYQEKYGRSHAIRVGDLYRDTFSDKLAAIVEFKNRAIAALDPDFEPFDAKQIEAEYLG